MRTSRSYSSGRASGRRPTPDAASVHSARVIIATVGTYAAILHLAFAPQKRDQARHAVPPKPRPALPGAVGRAVSSELPSAPAARIAPRKGPRMALAPTAPRPHRWDRDLWAHPSRGNYRRCFHMIVTAYRPINTRMEGGRWTKTERDGRAEHGVAVDPGLIPLGAHLWIPGYGHAVADDTGGMIRGHHIDLRMQQQESMEKWGKRQQVPVYILADATVTP